MCTLEKEKVSLWHSKHEEYLRSTYSMIYSLINTDIYVNCSIAIHCYVKFTRESYPIGSMCGTFAYIYHKNQPNVGEFARHGSCGYR